MGCCWRMREMRADGNTPCQQRQSTEGTHNSSNNLPSYIWIVTVTTTTTTTVLRPFVRDLDEPLPEVTFTHSHLSWSSTILYQLPPSTMIHSIFPVQFTCLTVFLHNPSPSPLWSTSWSGSIHFILRTFLYPIIVFFSEHLPLPSQPVFLL